MAVTISKYHFMSPVVRSFWAHHNCPLSAVAPPAKPGSALRGTQNFGDFLHLGHGCAAIEEHLSRIHFLSSMAFGGKVQLQPVFLAWKWRVLKIILWTLWTLRGQWWQQFPFFFTSHTLLGGMGAKHTVLAPQKWKGWSCKYGRSAPQARHVVLIAIKRGSGLNSG